MHLKISIIIGFFILGLLFNLSYKHKDLVKETFDVMDKCPNLLIKQGKEIHLVNTKKALIPGVNPIKFESLEDYAQFIKYQQHLNIKCPILYYQETYDVQNNKGFRLHNDPLDVDGGLPSHIAKEYNINNSSILAKDTEFIDTKKLDRKTTYKVDNTNHIKQVSPVDFSINHNKFTKSMDPQDQKVGVKSYLDNIEMDTNPMSSSWEGHDKTDKAIKMGDFDGQKRENNWIDDELKLRQMSCSGCKK
jgi:hypothetical protein